MGDNHVKTTVHNVTYDLLRSLGLTTVFGNPGSTEQTFLSDFPDDFTYVLALQEASAIGIADGFAQSTGRPALVNLHSVAGLGNSMGNMVAANKGHTPLIVTSGQQHREMVIGDPYLSNPDATNMPRPWVKWSYEPARAEDVPEAFMRAYAMALQPPAGPVYLSIPLDDWDRPLEGPAIRRSVSSTFAPDPARLRHFADRISASQHPALIIGPDVDRAHGWQAAVALAEKLNAAVFSAPLSDRGSFPEDHRLYQGPVGMSYAEISGRLAGHDLVVVVGAEVFRYYPFVAGDILPHGTDLLQITHDPMQAGAARVGDSLLGDARMTMESLTELVADGSDRTPPATLSWPHKLPAKESSPLTPDEVYAALSRLRPPHAVILNESTSTMAQHAEWLPTIEPESYYGTPSGGIGWGLPATVGVALGLRDSGDDRPVIGLIGDGSFHYSIQSLWTAAQHNLPIVFVAMRNGEYSILKSFAELEHTPGVPGMDLPDLDIAAEAHGLGCGAAEVETIAELEQEFRTALAADGPTVIVVRTQPQKTTL
ncbi:benzoylformate decarboxylase [Asanoa ishikariensis]|uniref:Benzoylformate decarboxylase n=1 Tax=Asanoa ishikariensis TaxID=137265 RepID=A0A1H3UMT3_9ACTN|nr:benzoylformate decarboxylase [Asanoa ishikariensis]GIF69017.1 benzoylformate decarboxylase [Asanoa ishikariensis]SDZ63752.1 benzoylformate decarboxylase [Asanoa ishikariensis]